MYSARAPPPWQLAGLPLTNPARPCSLSTGGSFVYHTHFHEHHIRTTTTCHHYAVSPRLLRLRDLAPYLRAA